MNKGWVGLKLKIYLLNTHTETTFMAVNGDKQWFHVLNVICSHFAEGVFFQINGSLKKKKDNGNSK